MVIVISGQLDYSVSPSQVGLRTLGLGLYMNKAGHSLLVVNIYDICSDVKFCIMVANFRHDFLSDTFT